MKKLTIFSLLALAFLLSGCINKNLNINKTADTTNQVNLPIAKENTEPVLVNSNFKNDDVKVNNNTNINNDQAPDPLANWQTFDNPNGNYSFKYSPSWNAIISKYNNKNSLFGPSATNSTGLGGVELVNFSGSATEYVKYLTENAAINFTSKKDTTINGLSAVEVNYTGVANQIGHGVYLKNGSQIINIYINSQDQNNIEIFNKLLSTFKFVK